MHSVVCLKQVPDTSQVHIDPKTGTMQRAGVPSIINPFDIHAVEEAMRVKDKYGGKVTVISMGPPQATEALKKAVSFGVDRAILITDRAFAGSDTLATSYVLAQAIRKIRETEPVDLIFCGKQTIDGDTAQVGPGIAARLEISQLTYIKKIREVDPQKREVTVERKVERGHEVIVSRLPALLTVVQELNIPRRASFPELLRAARFEVEIWNKDSLNVDPAALGLKGSPTTVKRIFAPPTRPGGEMITDGQKDLATAVGALVEKLLVRDALGRLDSLTDVARH
ncbi:MAG: electron transfer flavoprotein subunit beta/FixA family protein [Firmicutes bacterium]|nr:electron transfer flavoprotein subunit beta/FixA family protein [Bacillota bacterium]